MKHFLDQSGLSRFLARLKTIFIGNITTDNSSENAASGTITFSKKNFDGEIVETTVAVKNVVTTDTTQTIKGDKTFTGTVTVPTPTDQSTDAVAANKGYVDSKIAENDAMTYKGAVVPNSETGAHLPFVAEGSTKNRVDFRVGSTFKAAAKGTYYYAEGGGAGKEQAARPGDLFIVNDLTEITPSTTPKTWTITWDYIPAADDVTSVQYSADGTGINVGTSATYGQAIFGEAAIKPVDTTISANSTSTNVPTTDAVTDYVDARAGKSIVAATNSTAGIDIKLMDGQSEASQLAAINVKSNNKAVDVNVVSGNVEFTANVDEDTALKIDSTNGIQINNGTSIEFTGTAGSKAIDVKVDSTTDSGNSHGLSVTANGLYLAPAVATGEQGATDGAMTAADKAKLNALDTSYANKLDAVAGTTTNTVDLKLKNNGSTISTLDTVTVASGNTGALTLAASGTADTSDPTTLTLTVNTGNGISDVSGGLTAVGNNAKAVSVDGSGIGVDIDTTAGLEYSNNAIAINDGAGIEFNGTSGAIQVKGNTNKSIEVDATNGVGVVANTAQGINTTSNGVGITVLTNSGLAFDATQGGQENGALYIETITNNEIDELFV